jgi:CheY-like chemotaxis protein
MKAKPSFIIIDDEENDNFICEAILRTSHIAEEVRTFVSAKQALAYISKDESIAVPAEDEKKIILLDIHMPMMNGWEFLDQLDHLPVRIKDRYKLYILSSSVNLQDKQRARANKYICDFLVKPLTVEMVLGLTA